MADRPVQNLLARCTQRGRGSTALMSSCSGAAANPPVCVLGMHRSGTSLTALLINKLGIDFGDESTMEPPHRVDNPLGHMEQLPLMELNDALLTTMGGTWETPPVLPPGWHRSPKLDSLRAHAASLVADMYPNGSRWGWKDPRTSLTLPFWRDVIGPMDYVICVRRPEAVADSIARRYRRYARGVRRLVGPQFRRRHWLRLWQRYTEAALDHTSGGRRLIVVYERYQDDAGAAVARLRDFLEIAPNGEREAMAVIRPELWRNRTAGAPSPNDDARRAAELYDDLAATPCTSSR
jgi:hypothetical protein